MKEIISIDGIKIFLGMEHKIIPNKKYLVHDDGEDFYVFFNEETAKDLNEQIEKMLKKNK